jgi:regulator of replication initiation timing
MSEQMQLQQQVEQLRLQNQPPQQNTQLQRQVEQLRQQLGQLLQNGQVQQQAGQQRPEGEVRDPVTRQPSV